MLLGLLEGSQAPCAPVHAGTSPVAAGPRSERAEFPSIAVSLYLYTPGGSLQSSVLFGSYSQDDFDVDHFVSDCRKRVQLEELRDDLELYYKLLKTAMVELINKDYADFVNLSTNLVTLNSALPTSRYMSAHTLFLNAAFS